MAPILRAGACLLLSLLPWGQPHLELGSPSPGGDCWRSPSLEEECVGLAEEGTLERKCHLCIETLLVFVNWLFRVIFSMLKNLGSKAFRTEPPGSGGLLLFLFLPSVVTKRFPAPTHLDSFLKEEGGINM